MIRPSKLAQGARQLVRRTSPFTYWLSLVLPGSDRPYFWMWYAYLRSVDDFVDSCAHSVAERRSFIEGQLNLVRTLYEGPPPPVEEHEQYLAAVVSYDLERGRMLERPLHDMLEAIKSDLLSAGEIVEQCELDENHEREVFSYLSALAYFCRLETGLQPPPGSQAALAAKRVHVLRDAIPDLATGRFKVSRQDLTNLGITIQSFRDTTNLGPLRRWVATKAREAHASLHAGLLEVRACRSLRYRLMVAILVSKYQTYLRRLQANHFILKEPEEISLISFLQHFVRNLAFVTLLNRQPVSNSASNSLGPLLRATTTMQIIPFWILNPWTHIIVALHLRKSMRGGGVTYDAASKLQRRFVTAYHLGKESFKFVDRSSSARGLSHRAGLVYAYWAASVLELDRIIDQGAIGAALVDALCSSWLDAIDCEAFQGKPKIGKACKSAELEPGDDGSSRITRRFSVLAAEFVRQTSLFYQARSRSGHAVAEAEFLSGMKSFLAAQVMSQEQSIVCDAHDWSWYYLKVLNQKTLGFFTVPISLWSSTQASGDRSRELIDKFVLLNQGYVHWQLLDDVADVLKDTTDGLVTAPGYILLSQGSLAQAWANEETRQRCKRFPIGEVLTTSLLLCDHFRNSSLLDSVRQEIGFSSSGETFPNVTAAVHCSLANVPADLSIPLEELGIRRIEQARQYAAAMQSHNWREAIRWLDDSAAASRIVIAVDDEPRRVDAALGLADVADTSLFRVLYILETLIRRAYQKARQAVSRDVDDGQR